MKCCRAVSKWNVAEPSQNEMLQSRPKMKCWGAVSKWNIQYELNSLWRINYLPIVIMNLSPMRKVWSTPFRRVSVLHSLEHAVDYMELGSCDQSSNLIGQAGYKGTLDSIPVGSNLAHVRTIEMVPAVILSWFCYGGHATFPCPQKVGKPNVIWSERKVVFA